MKGGRNKPQFERTPMPSVGSQLAIPTSSLDAGAAQSQVSIKKQWKKSQIIGVGHLRRVIGSLLSADEIRKMAVCDLADTAGDRSCLEDPRMGSREYDETCATCHCDYGTCIGHFGMISINPDAWFLHPFFVDDGTIASVLNLFCYECFDARFKATPEGQIPNANMLFDSQQIRSLDIQYRQYTGIERLKLLANKAKTLSCSQGHTTTFFKKSTSHTIVQVLDKTTSVDVDVRSIFFHLTSISNYLEENTLHKFIGFSPMNYENFVIQVIPVLPTRNRPSIVINGKKNESEFTSLYWTLLDIIRQMQLPVNIGNDTKQFALRKDLREVFYAYIDSEANVTIKGRSKKTDALKTLMAIFDKKGGLYHKNTLSARVDNSGRTVIGADNSIRPNEVRIPKYMAEKFRIKLNITSANKDIAEELIRKDVIKMVVRNPHGGELNITEITDDNRERFTLQVGDLTYRRMVTGDAVVVNRQPTLHRWSILMMKAVVLETEEVGKETNTVGMNTAYVSGFNADFDGDEVHVHVPAGIEARAEAAALMAVEKAPISDQTSQSIFGLIQNTVWGSYEMTKNVRNLTKEDWYSAIQNVQDFEGPIGSEKPDLDLIARIKYVESETPKIYTKYGIKNLGLYNTQSLLSLALPEDFSYTANGVYIERGIIVDAVFTKSIVGAGANSIIQVLFESHGPTAIVIFAHVMQQVVASWMETQGFTISITDFMPGEDLQEKIENLKDEKLRYVKEVGQRNVHGVFNQDLLLSEMRNWLKEIPVQFEPILSKQTIGRLINEMVFVLFDFMQIERNLFTRGRSAVLFRPEQITIALKKAIDKIIETPSDVIGDIKPGQLSAATKISVKSKNEVEREKALVQELKTFLMDRLNNVVTEFVNEQMSNPFSPDSVSTKSHYETATIEADVMAALDAIKSDGIQLLMMNPTVGGSVTPMIKSKARGNEGNLFQAKFGMGQQTMSNARLKEAISGGTRVLPFFLENDPDPAARGYIRNSLFQGLNPTEWISAAMPTRQTQTDTAFKTADTGYMQKKLTASCGDFLVHPDGSVRDEQGQIVTHSYGGHFFDPSRMSKMGDNFSFVDVQQLVNQVKAEEDSKIKTRKEWFRKF